ncbi:MAG: ribbon-helix-helix protein, CopG family [Gemmatimonadaceae bacterium]
MPGKHTTVRLNPALLRKVKAYARGQHITMTAVMERALAAYLEQPRTTRPGTPFEFPTFSTGGVRPGVNLDDTSQLLDIMDGLD